VCGIVVAVARRAVRAVVALVVVQLVLIRRVLIHPHVRVAPEDAINAALGAAKVLEVAHEVHEGGARLDLGALDCVADF